MMRWILGLAVVAALLGGGWFYGYQRLPEDKRDAALKPTFALVYAVVAAAWVLGLRGARDAEATAAAPAPPEGEPGRPDGEGAPA